LKHFMLHVDVINQPLCPHTHSYIIETLILNEAACELTQNVLPSDLYTDILDQWFYPISLVNVGYLMRIRCLHNEHKGINRKMLTKAVPSG